MNLNGWQRIGVIASVLWLGGAAYVNFIESPPGGPWVKYRADQAFKNCIDDPSFRGDAQGGALANPADLSDDDLLKALEADGLTCRKAREMFIEEQTAKEHRDALWYTLSPIGFGWLGAYVFLWLFAWVRRGFRREAASSPSMN